MTVAATPIASTTGVCPNCGDVVAPGGRGRGKVFCRPKCRELFSNRAKTDGAPLYAFVMAWMETKHAKPGTREAEIRKVASREVGAMCKHFRERDAEEGRPPMSDYVETLTRDGGRYMDRTRR